MFENRWLKKIFEPRTDEVTEGSGYLHRGSLTCTLRMIKSRGLRWQCM
jgi:hypothetical protein